MNKLVFSILVFSACASLMANETASVSDQDDVVKEGGLIQKPYRGKYIVIINNQKRIPASQFFAEGCSIEDIFNFPVKVLERKDKITDAGVIVQVNDDKTAPSLTVLPEANWAGVNVAALATDNPKPEVLKKRIQKEIMRAYLYAAGVANSEVQPCLMRVIRNARDLDKCSVMQPGPSAVMPVMNSAALLGIFEKNIMTYREACEEGWAPQPTNEVQKAIWDKVHAIPSDPIKIKYEKPAGK